MLERDLSEINARLAAKIGEKLKVRRGATLEEKLRHAGRRIPAPERRAGRKLVEAEPMWGSLKLRRQLDLAGLEEAERRLEEWLDGIGRADRRRGMVLGILATNAFNFLVIAAGVIAWLWYSGRI